MSRSHDPRGPHEDDRETRLSSAPAFTFRSGEVILDRFRVIRFIARGGMGEVYEADDLELGERVALKAIRPEIAADTRVNQRFRREVQLARKVTHPNICRIFDLFQCPPPWPGRDAEPIVFVTMELLEGETLAQRLRRDGRMTVAEAEPLVAQMVAALSAAHDAGASCTGTSRAATSCCCLRLERVRRRVSSSPTSALPTAWVILERAARSRWPAS